MISATDILQAKILIVDDQPVNVQLLDYLLTSSGYTAVSSTTDPRVVAGWHAEHCYDLIILDLHMPGMDGFEVMDGAQAAGSRQLPAGAGGDGRSRQKTGGAGSGRARLRRQALRSARGADAHPQHAGSAAAAQPGPAAQRGAGADGARAHRRTAALPQRHGRHRRRHLPARRGQPDAGRRQRRRLPHAGLRARRRCWRKRRSATPGLAGWRRPPAALREHAEPAAAAGRPPAPRRARRSWPRSTCRARTARRCRPRSTGSCRSASASRPCCSAWRATSANGARRSSGCSTWPTTTALTGLPNRTPVLPVAGRRHRRWPRTSSGASSCCSSRSTASRPSTTRWAPTAATSCCASSATGWCSACASATRSGRFGGDEFALILTMTRDQQDAVVVANAVREALRAPFDLHGQAARADGQHRHRHVPRRRRRRRHADQVRRHGDGPRQGGRPRRLPLLHGRHERAGAGAARPGNRAAPRRSSSDEFVLYFQPKVQPAAPAASAAPRRCCAGTAARPRHGVAGRVRAGAGGDGPDRARRRLGHRRRPAARSPSGRARRSGRCAVAVNVSSRQFVEGDLEQRQSATRSASTRSRPSCWNWS